MIFTIGICMYGAARLYEFASGSFIARQDWKARAGMLVGIAGLSMVAVSLGMVAWKALP